MKLKNGTSTTLTVLALVFPLSGASFVLNLILTVFYYTPLSASFTADLNTMVSIFVPLAIFIAAFVMALLVVLGSKDKTLAITALILNSIGIVSGLFTIYTVYFAGTLGAAAGV